MRGMTFGGYGAARIICLASSLLTAISIVACPASAQPNVVRTFCYEELTNASTGHSTIYFTNVFSVPKDRAFSLLGELAQRMIHDSSERSGQPNVIAAKPVCSFEHQGSAEQDLEETIRIYERKPNVAIARIAWSDF
jgi:hypothetical protein